MQLLVGTTKGLLVLDWKSNQWQLKKDHFLGLPVSMIFVDPVFGDWWIGLASKHWGQKLHRSRDQGKNWEEIPTPRFPASSYVRPGKPATLKLIWSMAKHKKERRIWIGTEPGGLFYSDDDGGSFHLVQTLWDHPSREKDWFGGGRNEAGIHSILIHPRNPKHLYIGVSCGGVYESLDFGSTWHPINTGLKAMYLPDPHSEAGHDPHSMHISPTNPDILWQQNHCGVFRSKDGGQQWKDVTSKDDFGRYGFALAVEDDNPEEAWIIPAQADECRVAKDLKLNVSHTRDGGKTWEHISEGLPDYPCFDLVFRHGLIKWKDHLIFGTTTGHLFHSSNRGQSWALAKTFLPPIHVIQIDHSTEL